jgi:acyl-CoA reductase-like NAD-dependent aldehyde dehydrogenase
MDSPTAGARLRLSYDALFIGGAWVPPATGATDGVVNPATEAVIGHAPLGSAEDCRRAIGAARHAFDQGAWPGLAGAARAVVLQRLAELVSARHDEIIELMRLEIGITRPQAEFQYQLASTQIRSFIELAARNTVKSLPILISPTMSGSKTLGGAITARDPIGVVACITPFNSGFLLGMLKAVPALAAGNSVIVKPSPFTPLQTMLIAELVAELDLPPGAFNIVTGGADVGELLTTDPRVDMISFTGSDVVGGKVMAQAAPTLKKVHLELGGKSALIIRHDAEMEKAVMAGIFGFVFMAGQGCALTTRMLVDNRIRSDFVAALAAATAHVKTGDPDLADTGMGPLIRDAACTRTDGFVQRAIGDGATLVCGGKRPPGLARGFFYEPTLLDNVANDSELGQREVFGPVGAIIGFDTDEQAVRLANQSDYGLSGGIISRETGIAMEMALKLRTGQVNINLGPGGLHPDMPFGGYKRSGLGREWGEAGFHEYTELKSIGFPAGA